MVNWKSKYLKYKLKFNKLNTIGGSNSSAGMSAQQATLSELYQEYHSTLNKVYLTWPVSDVNDPGYLHGNWIMIPYPETGIKTLARIKLKDGWDGDRSLYTIVFATKEVNYDSRYIYVYDGGLLHYYGWEISEMIIRGDANPYPPFWPFRKSTLPLELQKMHQEITDPLRPPGAQAWLPPERPSGRGSSRSIDEKREFRVNINYYFEFFQKLGITNPDEKYNYMMNMSELQSNVLNKLDMDVSYMLEERFLQTFDPNTQNPIKAYYYARGNDPLPAGVIVTIKPPHPLLVKPLGPGTIYKKHDISVHPYVYTVYFKYQNITIDLDGHYFKEFPPGDDASGRTPFVKNNIVSFRDDLVSNSSALHPPQGRDGVSVSLEDLQNFSEGKIIRVTDCSDHPYVYSVWFFNDKKYEVIPGINLTIWPQVYPNKVHDSQLIQELIPITQVLAFSNDESFNYLPAHCPTINSLTKLKGLVRMKKYNMGYGYFLSIAYGYPPLYKIKFPSGIIVCYREDFDIINIVATEPPNDEQYQNLLDYIKSKDNPDYFNLS